MNKVNNNDDNNNNNNRNDNNAENKVALPSSAVNALAADFATLKNTTSVNPLQSNSPLQSVKDHQAMANLTKINEVYEGDVDSVKADNERAVLHRREGSEVISAHESSNTARADEHDAKSDNINSNHINK